MKTVIRKVVLIDLPQSYCCFNMDTPYTVQMGTYYLKAMAHRDGLLRYIDIIIFDTAFTANAGDALLIDKVIKEEPDIIGFSCFCWNIERSLYIAGEIKNILRDVKILVGGPEITPDALEVLHHHSVDIGVIGEGEQTFAELLRYFLGKGKSLEKIEGIFYKSNGRVILNPERFPIDNLDEIPSPFLLGYVSVFHGIEITRGCPFRCKYCYYRKGLKQVRSFSLKRIKEELTFIQKNKIDTSVVRIYGSTFNMFPKDEFKNICDALGKINNAGNMIFLATIRADIVDEEQAERLFHSGIRQVSVGLQSVEKTALNNVGRTPNIDKFVKGVNFLRNRGINVKVEGGILGLPGDTPCTIERMYQFLIKEGLAKTAEMYPLYLLPGTVLREEADDFGIKFAPLPPYYVLSTPKLRYTDIRQALIRYEEISSDSHYRYIKMPLPYLSLYSQGGYTNKSRKISCKKQELIKLKFPVALIQCYITGSKDDISRIDKLSSLINRQTSSNIVFWFKIKKSGRENVADAPEKMLNNILKSNPYIDYHIVIEADFKIKLDELLKIKNDVINKYYNYSDLYWHYRNKEKHRRQSVVRLSVIYPWNCNFDKDYFKELRNNVFLIWLIDIDLNTYYVEKNIAALMDKDGDGVLVDFFGYEQCGSILRCLNILKCYNKNKQIRFKNWAIEQIWNSWTERTYLRKNYPRLTEGTLISDNTKNIEIFHFEKEELLADLAEWKLCFLSEGSLAERKENF